MPKEFKTIEEFGKAFHKDRAEDLKQKMDDIFEKSIKDDFESIPEGPFKSSFPEISWIAFARPKDRKTGESNPNILNAVIFSKTESGKNINHTWTVNKNGTIRPIQEIPVNLAQKYSQEELALEVAGLLERIGPSFFHLTDLDIMPSQDLGVLGCSKDYSYSRKMAGKCSPSHRIKNTIKYIMSEFNPKEFKSFTDLPDEEKPNFQELGDGGFVRKESEKNPEVAHRMGMVEDQIINTLKHELEAGGLSKDEALARYNEAGEKYDYKN